MKVHFENESTFWKWKFFFHTLSWRDLMPFTWVHKNYIHSHSSQKWKHISKMKAHSKNESIFQKWEHISQNKSIIFHTLSWRDLMPSSWVNKKDMHPHSFKAHFENERRFWKWKHILKWKFFFHTLSWRDLMPSSWVHMKDMHPHSGTMKWCLNCLHVHISTWHFLP